MNHPRAHHDLPTRIRAGNPCGRRNAPSLAGHRNAPIHRGRPARSPGHHRTGAPRPQNAPRSVPRPCWTLRCPSVDRDDSSPDRPSSPHAVHPDAPGGPMSGPRRDHRDAAHRAARRHDARRRDLRTHDHPGPAARAADLARRHRASCLRGADPHGSPRHRAMHPHDAHRIRAGRRCRRRRARARHDAGLRPNQSCVPHRHPCRCGHHARWTTNRPNDRPRARTATIRRSPSDHSTNPSPGDRGARHGHGHHGPMPDPRRADRRGHSRTRTTVHATHRGADRPSSCPNRGAVDDGPLTGPLCRPCHRNGSARGSRRPNESDLANPNPTSDPNRIPCHPGRPRRISTTSPTRTNHVRIRSPGSGRSRPGPVHDMGRNVRRTEVASCPKSVP